MTNPTPSTDVRAGDLGSLPPTRGQGQVPRVHVLKTWPGPFAAVRARVKPFEIRFNDRDFQPGDTLWLEEFDPVTQTKSGEVEVRFATFVLEGGQFGIEPGFAAIGMTDMIPFAEEACAAVSVGGSELNPELIQTLIHRGRVEP